jgi:predicted phosphodiesterase
MKTIHLSLIIVLTVASASHGYELIIIGDSRSGAGNEYFQRTRHVITDAIEYTERNYDNLIGIVMTGDYVKSGKNDDQWTAWIEANARAFDYPLYPCVGNHDDENTPCEWWDTGCEQAAYFTWNYYRTFAVDRWWSADVEGLHLISVDSNLEGFNDDTLEGDLLEELQYEWFKNDLAMNGNRPTLVFWHDPAYASYSWFGEGHGSNRFMRSRYVSLCEQYNVKMIAYGHNHWYERFTVNGIKHVTTGGGGAPLLPVTF